ncbi:MAG: pilus assembly protein PilP, partial [Chromatiaceae bacterium]|nr:pilus assembly protein PilP [Chromatiaceae bacterium]
PGGMAPDPHRPRENLERFALDSLLMQGILQQDDRVWGLVFAKEDKTLHRVAVGNYLGQNHGRVIRITEQRIDLVELIQDGAGRWMEREASIALNQNGKRVK